MKGFSINRVILLILMSTFILSGCGKPFLSTLTPAGEVAKSQYDLMLLSTAIMIGVIAVVTLIFILVIVKFRRKDEKIPKQIEGNHRLEIIWTIIPIILLIVLAVPTVTSTIKLADVSPIDKRNEEGKRDALVVNVRANLYWWEFEYPDYKIVTAQELVVPTDERVYFNLKAADVKHSFWIPSVGGKMDTNIDGVNQFWLEFDRKYSKEAGNIFFGKCAELCGSSHALMDFKVKTLSKNEFSKWIANMQNVKEPKKAETALAQQGQEIFNNSCIGCHAITPSNSTPEAARLAPNLTNFGDRSTIAGILTHNEKNLKSWLTNPDKYKPGNKMTKSYNKLSEKELNALSEYLMNLKVGE